MGVHRLGAYTFRYVSLQTVILHVLYTDFLKLIP
jgi:hypothetical protein